MSDDGILALTILALTILMFIRDTMRPDIVGLCTLLALLASGILTPGEAFAGFSDPLVILLAALFVVGSGLEAAGVTAVIAHHLGRVAGTGEIRILVVLMTVTALLSSILSSTGTVALLIPVAVSLAARAGISPSRVLIPLAMAAGLGGTLTLVGTPPNLVVNEALVRAGQPPLGFFALFPVGALLVLCCVVFCIAARRWLPDRCPPAVVRAGGDTTPRLDRRGWTALAIMAGMLGLLIANPIPAVTSVLLAVAALGLTRCIGPQDMYRYVPVGTVVLVATMLPMSTALTKTGVVDAAVAGAAGWMQDLPIHAVIAALFVVTSTIGLVISNTATAVLVAPVAAALAAATGTDPRVLLLTVAFAASSSLATPIATPMNALVLEPGHYRFADFARLGLPLQVLLGILVVLLVPAIYGR